MILNYSDCDAGANPLTMPPLYLDWVLGAAPLSTSTYLKYPNHGCDIVAPFAQRLAGVLYLVAKLQPLGDI